MPTVKWKKTVSLSVFIFVSASAFARFFHPGLHFIRCYIRIFWSLKQRNHHQLEINDDVTLIFLGLMFKQLLQLSQSFM